LNVSTINASNIVGYQEELIAGTNITIVGNTISSAGEPLPTNANFSSVNTSTLNTSTINSSSAIIDSITATDLTLTSSEFPLTIPNGQLNVRQINISRAMLMEGSDSFLVVPLTPLIILAVFPEAE